MDTAGVGKGGNGADSQGEAKIMLDEEEFRRGVSVEEFGAESKKEVMGEEKPSLKAEEVKRILFDGKTFDSEQGQSTCLPLWSFTVLPDANIDVTRSLELL